MMHPRHLCHQGRALRGVWEAAHCWAGSALGWALAPGQSWVHTGVEEGWQANPGCRNPVQLPTEDIWGGTRYRGAIPGSLVWQCEHHPFQTDCRGLFPSWVNARLSNCGKEETTDQLICEDAIETSRQVQRLKIKAF